MNAKEMFEKLGYSLQVYNVFQNGGFKDYVIEYKKDMSFISFEYLGRRYKVNDVLTIELHQIITQQMKELGWLE